MIDLVISNVMPVFHISESIKFQGNKLIIHAKFYQKYLFNEQSCRLETHRCG